MGFTVSDIYSEITSSDGVGNCNEAQVFSYLTDALKLISDKAHYDFKLGTLDITVCDACVTLPDFVTTVLSVTTCGQPTYLRDSWYGFHLNGVGHEKWTDCGYTDELGQFCTFRDPVAASQLVAVVEETSDNNKQIRVFGWDINGERIYSDGPNGTRDDGFLVPTIAGYPLPNPNVPLIARVDRISLQLPRKGVVRLVAVDPANTDSATNKILLGVYEPTTAYPSYRRIRLGSKNSWARIKYRKKDAIIRSQNDWIDVDNKLAILLACQAVKHYRQGRVEIGDSTVAKATQMLSDGQNVKQTPTGVGPQIVVSTEWTADTINGYGCGWYGGGGRW
jgi:hypothetical protein